MDIYKESIELHKKIKGKLEIKSKISIKTKHDLSLAYTPGVAGVCKKIAKNKKKAYDLTIKGNSVAVVSDGSAVLGLGNIGPEAALPVMEGKALLFKEYANIDAIPLCLDTQDSDEIISIVKAIAPNYAGINLEDISAPRCFEIEEKLQDLGIPVFHDDQHGTAIVLLAGMLNSLKLAGKNITDVCVVINGAGAAGTAIANLLRCVGYDDNICEPVKDIIVCDSEGIICKERKNLNDEKKKFLGFTNKSNKCGSLADAIKETDVFIGVSKGKLLNKNMIQSMNEKPIILAMANPVPEVMPEDAKKWGAFIVGTGRSDFPNQINNVLAFPGIFRGAIDAKASRISNKMKIMAAHAIAGCVKPTVDEIIPSPLDKKVAVKVAEAVKKSV
jgi:malate dehydrogenase (oxaloacetate-decarboxylating)